MENIELLNDVERLQLPIVLQRRATFQRIMKNSLQNALTTFSNCLMVQGQAGTGKTTIVVNYLDTLKELGVIHDYKRVAGHITPRSLYNLFYATANLVDGLPSVLVLDDCDFMMDQGCLELAKAAFDTRSNSPQNRRVFYQTETGSGFKYNGYGIIITNNEFNPDRVTVHQQALLDRVNLMCIDLKKDDMFVYNTYLVEDYLNKNEDCLSEDEIQNVIDLFNNEIREWDQAGAFARTKINFSIRLIKKFVDCIRLYGKDDWKVFSTIYQRLHDAAELAAAEAELAEATGVEVQNANPKKTMINPKTGLPFSQCYINKLIRQGKISA